MPRFAAPLLLASAGACMVPAQAQMPTTPPNPQVIEPQVARRDIALPKFPSRDFELGAFVGTYATENFGSSFVYGFRLGYHITEDFFVSAAYGQTEVSDENFRQILPGGVFVNQTETLQYYNLSAGYNVISGEAFFGRNVAKPLQGYLIAGVGSTDFAGQKKQTINVGFGLRLFLHDRLALQADVRDHLFSLDLLGKSQSTQNIEISVGLSTYF
jgi:outer membrane beta-barrel protein